MSRDIRSYFSTISKKVVSTEKKDDDKEKNSKTKINTSNSDIIPKKHTKLNKDATSSKRKRIVTVSSDSESEKELKVKPAKTPKKEADEAKSSEKKIKTPLKSTSKKKLLTPLEAFGSTPVKQDKIEVAKELELNIHSDDEFEKTLLELDEEELLHKADENATKKETIHTVKNESSSMKAPTKSPLKTPNRKRKSSESNDDSIDTDQERYEKKRHSAMLYQKYLHRSGPAHLGTKWIPKGKVDCLKGLCFILTGVLESLERVQAESIIKEHGGRCITSVSNKVNYMVLGEEAGPAKVEKAKKLGIKMISEDDLIDLICVKSGISNQNLKPADTSLNREIEQDIKEEIPLNKKKTKEIEIKSKINTEIKKEKVKDKINNEIKKEKVKEIEVKSKINNEIKKENAKGKALIPSNIKKIGLNSLQWVDKYKPTKINEIIGQQGERSNVKKLTHWLETWQKNRKRESIGKGIPRPSPWAKDDSGAFFRAALLSGSPGVGKTTTATLVCKELGFDTVEFNASDTRNKKMIHNEVSQIIKSTSLAGFFNNGSAPSRQHVLLMDEVDGMSGNEDRGGIQELISIIKTTNIPIICLCNDRQHPKIRTLANYCFDLRFSKPRLEQIRGAMMSICFKEGIKISPEILSQIIKATSNDVRQTLNQLALWSANVNANTNKDSKQSIEKDIKLGPWEVIRKVFSEEEHKGMSLIDKSKLFFYDYSIAPLFVQENYLKVIPHCSKNEQLQRFANAADAISMGDVVDSKIRSTQNWSLLDLEAMYASVLPGHYLEGHFGGQIDFPSWLGKNSKTNKFQRLLSEINAHTRMTISGDRTAIALDYVRSLRDAIANPMLKKGSEGIPDSVAVMRAYNLLREDLTNLVELAHWPKSKDPFDGIDSKVKAAFTRTYNKEAPALPYAVPGAGALKNKRAAASANDDLYNDYEVDADQADDSNDENDITGDGMIKAKKPSTTKAATTSKGKATKTVKGSGTKRGSKK